MNKQTYQQEKKKRLENFIQYYFLFHKDKKTLHYVQVANIYITLFNNLMVIFHTNIIFYSIFIPYWLPLAPLPIHH